MAGPSSDDSTAGAAVLRANAEWKPRWQRFQTELMMPSHMVAAIHEEPDDDKCELHPYQRQYSHVYHQRYAQLAPQCQKTFQEHINNSKNNHIQMVERLLELDDDVTSFVVGTLVKDISPKSKGTEEPIVDGTDCRESDVLYLEDESGRVALSFVEKMHENGKMLEHNVHDYCTGLVVGVQGHVTEGGGTMLVDAVFLPKINPPPPLPKPADDKDAPYILFVSGLECGSKTVQAALPRDLLLCFLEGRLSHPAASRVYRVVICGGLISPVYTQGEDVARKPLLDALDDLDAWLFQITAGAGIPVDLIPGANDPTTANWPQRPLHHSLLLQSQQFGLLNRTPNPYQAEHGNNHCRVLATDGANVLDLQKRTLKKTSDGGWAQLTELEALKKTLEFGHVCPTGPSTVPTVPHDVKDPMVLQELPHVYVAGNCTQFGTDKVVVEGGNNDGALSSSSFCRVISVPSFAQTGKVVLLNLHTLDVELLRFQA